MKKHLSSLICLLLTCLAATAADRPKKLVMIAGTPSHPPLMHEFNAGVQLLAKCLKDYPGLRVSYHLNGWPKDEKAFDGADAVFIYCDGGARHLAVQENRLQFLDGLAKKGVGLGFAHYGVEVLADKGGKEFLDWIGGHYENSWSCNPIWEPDFKELPKHPITRGVQPFQIKDEWYFNMRFRADMKGVTPILVAKPSDAVRDGPYVHPKGPYPHIQAAKGRDEAVMWATERPDGGRGFGFTGGHYHLNWGNDNFRKVVLNALLWIAKVEVPAGGVQSKVTEEELMQNLDPKPAQKPPVQQPKPKAQFEPAAQAVAPVFKSGVLKSGSVNVDVDIRDAKGLWLVVTDGGDGYGCDWADWIEPQLVRADGSAVRLTDLRWASATSGWGKVQVNKNAGGKPLNIGGKNFENGIGTHAPSVIHYDLSSANFVRFKAVAGLDKSGTDQGCGSTVEFQVYTQTPVLTVAQTSPAEPAASVMQRGHGPEAAREYLKTMSTAHGLEVTLFASEPMVLNPTNMDIDHRGRVWITEAVNYRSTFKPWGVLRPAGDRIVILEDTNGDGFADKETVFYQGPEINAALGISVFDNKVVVACSPNVYVFTDTDGDDKADTKEILFTGISGVDHDHGVHAFVFGPDGKFYFNFGDNGRQIKYADGRPVVDLAGNEVNDKGKPYRKGMAFRCDLKGEQFETLGWNFRNPYEVAVDSFGTLWQSDNDDDGNKAVRINYVMEFGNFGYTDEMTGAGWRTKRTNLEAEIPQQHWYQNDPGVVPNLLITGAGSPTGILVYEGKLLPEVFRNQVIHCDAGPRVVRAYPVIKEGAGYSATVADILTSSDTWFRPADVCVAPDGSLYVADWNDPGVGGHNMGDRDTATMRGRVYRVAPVGHKPRVPVLDLQSAAGCVDALQSPNQATRYMAWTRLHTMQAFAEKELLKLWNGKESRMRARALHLLARIHGRDKHYIDQALKDADPDIRITGLRIARDLRIDVIPLVKVLAKDSSPQVRRECAIALRHNTSPEAPALWAQLASQHDGKDRWYLEALGIGMDKQEDAFFSAWLKQAGENWKSPAGRDIVWRSRSKHAPTLLAKLISDKNTPEPERARYFRALDFHSGPEKDAALVELLTLGSP